MSLQIDRRKFLAGTTAGSLFVLTLGGCKPEDKGSPQAAKSGASGAKTGSGGTTARLHYAMVFDQNKCIGCGLCKTACNEANDLPKGRSRLLLERQSTHVPARRVRSAENWKDATANAFTFVFPVSSVRMRPAYASVRPVPHMWTARPESLRWTRIAVSAASTVLRLALTTFASSMKRQKQRKTATFVLRPNWLTARNQPAFRHVVTELCTSAT